MTEKYRIEKARVEPMITLKVDQNWITFTIRYVVDYRLRRKTRALLFPRLLEEIAKNKVHIQIATSTLEVDYELSKETN
jgi:hypothetical protein